MVKKFRGAVYRLPHRVWAKFGNLPAQVALRILNTRPVGRRLDEHWQVTLLAHALSGQCIPQNDATVVRALRLNKFHLTSLDGLSLPGSTEMFEQALSLSAILAQRISGSGASNISASAQDLLQHPALFAWGVSERLLRLAEAYLGGPVAYDGLSYMHSAPDGREVGARQWHRDREDRRVLKIGVYITEVTEKDGPLQMVREGVNHLINRRQFHYKPVSDRAMQRCLQDAPSAGAVVTFTGPPGTVIFIDTAGQFHRGAPGTGRARSVIYFSYFSRVPRHPFFCERSPFSRSEITSLASGLTTFQKDCVLWRRQLPMFLKCLPRSAN